MDDINGLLRSVVRITSFFLSFCLLLWAFVPEARAISAGLALGAAASLANAMFLSSKVKRIAEQALGGGRRTGIGFWTRAAIAILAVLAAIKAPGINLYAVIAGLFFAQLAILVLGFVSSRKDL